MCVTRGKGEHHGGRSQSYYWPSMSTDALEYVKRCTACHKHGNTIHTPAVELHAISFHYPFYTWCFDLICPINPHSWGKAWTLTATEQFTRWVEAIPLRKASGEAMVDFMKEYIICRFEISKRIMSDNETPFINRMVKYLLDHYEIRHDKSTLYYPQGNGQAEATNKNLLRIIIRMIMDFPSN
ncbi:hypothetical protein L6164_013308 [Bauhinia variegata]|uniref:Uncharacterized protein n=1 Tax=Bauhinia variegata TaxID=167791 RepID=A0ACB9PBY4_BAUVA|nr:hypothetical protein L6164_013308 [Bauhinia variegata]